MPTHACIKHLALAFMLVSPASWAQTSMTVRANGPSAPLTALAAQAHATASEPVLARRPVGGRMQPLTRSYAQTAMPLNPLPALTDFKTSQVNTGGVQTTHDGIAASGNSPANAHGAAGAEQYVQVAGGRIAVYAKTNGALLLGPMPVNAIFAGAARSAALGTCAANNGGPAAVHYDQLANRWIITQSAWRARHAASGPYYQCIAVSTGADARGTYHRYAIAHGKSIISDDAKMAVWPDAYYFTFSLFSAANGDYRGPRACGIDRAALLRGVDAAVRCHDLGTSFGAVTPASLQGHAWPTDGMPAFLLSLDLTVEGSGERLFMWRYSFTARTLGEALAVPVAPFRIACPLVAGGACVQQPPPGEPLDALADRLSGPVSYRYERGHESLVANHAVRLPGGATAIRWYEIRTGWDAPQVYQQGSHAPNSEQRWIGSIGIDKQGNIALAYSVSGSATAPGIRYTGRQRTGAPGRLDAEEVIINGSGVQIDGAGRWGAPGSLTLDPVDDCTFWSTLPYIASSGRHTWRTRIARFRFQNCRPIKSDTSG